MTKKEKIKEIISKINIGQNIHTTFFDWVTMMAMSISNTSSLVRNDVWKKRENLYINIAQKYKAEQIKLFCEAAAYLAEELENDPYDILGEMYHKLDAQNKKTGQFFTPFHISLLLAEFQKFKDDEEIKMNEPACGSGGMILATAKVMKERGIDYRNKLKAIAQDIDFNCVYMAYVQLSFAGIKATVIQGDALKIEEPHEEKVFHTPSCIF